VKDTKIIIAKITNENRDVLFKLALSVYLGEKCKYCLKKFKTLEDLKDAVWDGRHKHGRLAHKKCWDENNGIA